MAKLHGLRTYYGSAILMEFLEFSTRISALIFSAICTQKKKSTFHCCWNFFPFAVIFFQMIFELYSDFNFLKIGPLVFTFFWYFFSMLLLSKQFKSMRIRNIGKNRAIVNENALYCIGKRISFRSTLVISTLSVCLVALKNFYLRFIFLLRLPRWWKMI